MDFLLLLPNRQHIVLEIDGIQHYADDNNVASPKKYADMVAGDRQLKLQGYELYRFGGYELMNDVDANAIVTDFFERLLKKYRVLE
jgi:very-short-patch-repair endonuclease